jgi:hypothetical protein
LLTCNYSTQSLPAPAQPAAQPAATASDSESAAAKNIYIQAIEEARNDLNDFLDELVWKIIDETQVKRAAHAIRQDIFVNDIGVKAKTRKGNAYHKWMQQKSEVLKSGKYALDCSLLPILTSSLFARGSYQSICFGNISCLRP